MKSAGFITILFSIVLLGSISCATVPQASRGPVFTGKASWYSVKTNGGTHTASGERFSNHRHTAAHKTLPMGTMVKVTNLRNGRSENVRITDRGPYIKGRVIDVSIGVARKLDFVNAGVVPVKVQILN